MKHLIWLLLFSCATHAVNGPCPQTNGTMTLNVVLSRISGNCISNCTVWVDATGTTDSSLIAGQTVIQDVTFAIDFGDTLTSGTSKWLYGSNAGNNLKRYATGGIGSHMYATEGRDTQYTITVKAQNPSGTVVSCGVGLKVFDPLGANGFATKICQSASGNFTGCPTGATHSTSAAESTNLSASMTNKMVLFHCGESYTGAANFGGAGPFMVGAYGGCQNTQTGRPIFGGTLTCSACNAVDGRINDLDFESSGSAVNMSFPAGSNQAGPMTLYNLNSNGNATSYYQSDNQQTAWVQVVMTGEGGQQGSYMNYGQTRCINGSTAFQCGQGAGAVYANTNYNAVQGSSIDGTGGTGSSEAFRMGSCRLCVFTNSVYKNSPSPAASFKFHEGNASTQNQWLGLATEDWEISDNEFTGTSGAECVEIAPQNNQTDEHIQFGVYERNYMHNCTGQLAVSCHFCTFRDNVLADTASQFAQRGSEYTPQANYPCANGVGTCPGAPPTNSEWYNNTFYRAGSGLNLSSGGGFSAIAGGINSVVKNNLTYLGSNPSTNASGNTISNNSTNTAANPAFTNSSGSFALITDFKPTANFTGGVSVPVVYDAVLSSANPYGTPWTPWDWGAVHH